MPTIYDSLCKEFLEELEASRSHCISIKCINMKPRTMVPQEAEAGVTPKI